MPTNPKPERNGWLFPTVFAIVAAISVGYITLQWSNGFSAKAPDSHAQEHKSDQESDHAAENRSSKVSSGSTAQAPNSGNTLIVSPQAEKNINMTTVEVKLDDFQRTVTIPGRVVEQAGHSRLKVSAPMTGIVEKIPTIRGETVHPGQPLFELRLTHEEVIRRQTDLLRLVQQLDVVNLELKRLEKIAASGAIAGKTLLNTQYEAQKLQAAINADQAGLLLLGLNQEQVNKIVTKGQLIRKIVVTATPNGKERHETCDCEYLLQVAKINVSVGQQVTAGETLAVLTDYCLLLIEGQALEQDAAMLSDAVKEKLLITAIIELKGKKVEIPNLRILFLDSEVNMETRALRFYAYLPNQIVNNTKNQAGRQFIEWKFRPGQRVELFLPIENWPDCIVLPREAVIQDGIESVVFLKQGTRITRKPIVEQYRDSRVVVIANDGTLFPGEAVVVRGAYQLFLKMKNRSAPVDPHAGHNH